MRHRQCIRVVDAATCHQHAMTMFGEGPNPLCLFSRRHFGVPIRDTGEGGRCRHRTLTIAAGARTRHGNASQIGKSFLKLGISAYDKDSTLAAALGCMRLLHRDAVHCPRATPAAHSQSGPVEQRHFRPDCPHRLVPLQFKVSHELLPLVCRPADQPASRLLPLGGCTHLLQPNLFCAVSNFLMIVFTIPPDSERPQPDADQILFCSRSGRRAYVLPSTSSCRSGSRLCAKFVISRVPSTFSASSFLLKPAASSEQSRFGN